MVKPPSEWTVLSMLKWATSYFEEKEVRNPRFSIEWLLAHVLKVKRLDLYLMYDRPLPTNELEILRPLVKRRSLHEPLQYITGEIDFLNVTIHVEPGVLIPRMETEQLVEMILEEHQAETPLHVVDIGTGSGCIPIAIKKNRKDWVLFGTDISEKALSIAETNRSLNNVEVTFFKDNVFSSTRFSAIEQFDIIISNPPYILLDEKNSLDKEVIQYEPESALFCESIESIYGALFNFSSTYLVKNGFVYLELHENHASEVYTIFNKSGWEVNVLKDYDKKNRFLRAKKVK